MVFMIQFQKMGIISAAGNAPACPKIQQDYLPLQAGEVDHIAIYIRER
jgi:hypothetical protein